MGQPVLSKPNLSGQYDFGPIQLESGLFEFKLWAPQARQVELLLYSDSNSEALTIESRQPLTAQDKGWYVIQANAGWNQYYHFEIDGDLKVPDPASRYQPKDVFGPSQLINPYQYQWQATDWKGLPFEEAVFYELHIGAFTPSGTYQATIEKLDFLKSLGVTAIELMPVADFPGQFNWGYDGVLQYAPDHIYGYPDDLKQLIDAAHQRGLMVFLDVVYNHFGPEGNFLYVYAKDFFNAKHQTPWGNAINFDGDGSQFVREFFIQNALYWLDEFRFDGLRLDAVHEIHDNSDVHFLDELNQRVQSHFEDKRHVHIVLENPANQARFIHPDQPMQSQWNDDFHHAAHTAVTNENQGYYEDYHYQQGPLYYLGRCLTEGFGYQGEASPFHDNAKRGEVSSHLHPKHFVNFIQNHDQTGNRAKGERLNQLVSGAKMKALAEIYLLAPSTPMLFMGEEFASQRPFLFFTDLGEHLADSIRNGRRQEFAKFPEFSDPDVLKTIPDPCAEETFKQSLLDWETLNTEAGQKCLNLYQQLLALRKAVFAELYPTIQTGKASYQLLSNPDSKPLGLKVLWPMASGQVLSLLVNLSDEIITSDDFNLNHIRVLYASSTEGETAVQSQLELFPNAVIWAII